MKEKKKRVLVDTLYLLLAMTGVRTYTLELCRSLESSQVSNEYLFFPDYKITLDSTFFKGDIPYWKKFFFQVIYFIWKVTILPIVARLKGVDAIISPDYVSPPQRMKAVKFAVVHDAFFWEYPANYNEWWRRYFIWLIGRGLSGRSVIITTSFKSKDSLNNTLKPQAPVEVVYQSSSSLPKKGDSRILEKLDLQSKKYIIHIGYFDKRKNLTTLVEAYHLLDQMQGGNDIKLVLAGKKAINSTLDDFGNVQDLIKKFSLEQKVILPGYLDSKELPGLYENALCYVFPSYSEGFGIPVIEAMSYGLPVIISSIDTLKEVAGDAALSFDTFNPQDLCDKMGDVIQNPALREQMADAGKIRSQSFSSEKFSSTIDQLVTKYA